MMVADIDIVVNKEEFRRQQAMLKGIPVDLDTILPRVVNSAASVARRVSAKGISAIVPVAGFLTGTTFVKWAGKGAARAVVSIIDKRIPVAWMNPQQTNAGVTFTAPGRGVGEIHGAFILEQDLPISAKSGVFARTGLTRLPIREQFASSAVEVWEATPSIGNEVRQKARQALKDKTISGIQKTIQKHQSGRRER